MESETKPNACHFSKGLSLSTEGVLVVISSKNVKISFLAQKCALHLPKISSGPKSFLKLRKM